MRTQDAALGAPNRGREPAGFFRTTIPALILSVAAVGFTGPAGAASVTYTYDVLGRVKTVQYSTGVLITYSYDAAGNRTSVVTTVPS
ncbi:RHS repeat domain-containing protein [Caldimonas brevitalea]|uniref:YD repeat-containing protein n=1 Tax=Caldimonas brevitalea TaxID=413882 RepID=A0A0G3BL89_9BURK|nr:RHS repeat domain-containing protein [Caldimonas brevitalea]AKJ30177.1 hypothetical protein AAW51_3486 [Caldimonas brevitalea]